MLLVNNTMNTVDTFHFTLLHEIAHIRNMDWRASMEEDEGGAEERAERYAEDTLIPPALYRTFFEKRRYDRESIISFAESIENETGIAVARLQKDGVVRYDNEELNSQACVHSGAGYINLHSHVRRRHQGRIELTWGGMWLFSYPIVNKLCKLFDFF